MERYDYFSAVKEDVKIVVMNEYNYSEELKEGRQAFEDKLNEELWVNDSVTGNS